ncbi:hypothetical protein ACRJ4W_35640 [Streptomyces sp. GLT-R25]
MFAQAEEDEENGAPGENTAPAQAAPAEPQTLLPAREQVHQVLTLLAVPAAPKLISTVHEAFFAGALAPSRLTSLRRDEERSYRSAPGARPYYLCPALTSDLLSPARGLLTVSTWSLEQRIVGPLSARVHFLTSALNIADAAERLDAEAHAAARPPTPRALRPEHPRRPALHTAAEPGSRTCRPGTAAPRRRGRTRPAHRERHHQPHSGRRPGAQPTRRRSTAVRRVLPVRPPPALRALTARASSRQGNFVSLLNDRLDALRGPAPAKGHDARTLAALTTNPGCNRRALLDAAGVDKDAIAVHLGKARPLAKSSLASQERSHFRTAGQGRRLRRTAAPAARRP